MKAEQITSFAMDGKTCSKKYSLKIASEEDKTEHLESDVINLYPEINYQKIHGFGGAITESVASLLKNLDSNVSESLLEEYFSITGNRLKFLRMHIDSCDYCLSEYQAVANPVRDPDFVNFYNKT